MKTPEEIAEQIISEREFGEPIAETIIAAIAADRAQATVTTYAVGDSDPTPEWTPYEDMCNLESPEGYACTWPKGHRGQLHVAGTGERIAAVWDA